jgi:exopolysaccharide biosynthesis WecB/TagA/CpsF family protein
VDDLILTEALVECTSGFVVTPNVDHLMHLQADVEFYRAYQVADHVLCDSKIIYWATRLLGTPLRDRLTGADFFHAYCSYHSANPEVTMFILGGPGGAARAAQSKINARVGRPLVVAAHNPSYRYELDEQESRAIVERITESTATVLAVGTGAPKSEKWILRHRHFLPHVRLFLAVGAAIEFEAGTRKRAPRWVGDIGLEWLFRLLREPRRLWMRYLVRDPLFFSLLLKQRLGVYADPFLAENSIREPPAP